MKQLEVTQYGYQGKAHTHTMPINSWVFEQLRLGNDTFNPLNKIEDQLERVENLLGFLTEKMVHSGQLDVHELVKELTSSTHAIKVVESEE